MHDRGEHNIDVLRRNVGCIFGARTVSTIRQSRVLVTRDNGHVHCLDNRCSHKFTGEKVHDMRKIPKVTMSSILAALLLLVLMLEIIPRIAFGLYQDGTLGSPGFTIEPVSLLVGLGVGALAVGIPAAAGSAARARKRKALPEQCDDGNTDPQPDAHPGNPIKGISVKGGRGGHIQSTDMVAGNPIGGLTIKGGKGDASPMIEGKIERTGAGDPEADNPPAEGTNASNPIPGVGIVVKRNFGPKSTK